MKTKLKNEEMIMPYGAELTQGIVKYTYIGNWYFTSEERNIACGTVRKIGDHLYASVTTIDGNLFYKPLVTWTRIS